MGADPRSTRAGRGMAVSRRAVVAGMAAGALAGRIPVAVAAPRGAEHAFSPLGPVAYGPDEPFAYVRPDAPRGGTLRQTRVGAFDSFDTLNYPARPPADLRLIYDRLIVQSDDEVASYYGLLARSIDVAPDYSRIVFELREEARWHDGRPVLAEDVAFTFATLKENGAPFYRQAYRPITVRADGPATVVVETERRGDRDILRTLAALPIHPRHIWAEGRPEAPVGSGPYRLETFQAPNAITLARVADYWAKDLAVCRGRWNFDALEFRYFRDPTVAFESFKIGDADVRLEDDPARWVRDYPTAETSALRREETPQEGVGELNGFAFNLRRPLLADRRVRLALALAWDFDAANELLFHGAHLPLESVFAGTDLAAQGAAGPGERALLNPPLPAEALAEPDPFASLPPAGSREALRAASALLDEAGLTLRDGARIDPETGAPISLSVLSMGPAFGKALSWLANSAARLGIELTPVRADPATSAKLMLEKDFDLASLSWSPARLPGTAERLLWHSALAAMPGSYALSGLASPQVDAAIEALERAAALDALATAGRAFDRAWREAVPMIPLWRSATVRIAWWDHFGRPRAETEGFAPSPLDRWWSSEATAG